MYYLAKFNKEGKREASIPSTLINNYGGEEKLLNEGYIKISTEDYQYYIGNKGTGDNGTGYIRNMNIGKPISSPSIKIDIKEIKTAKIAEMKAERDNREVQNIEYKDKMFDYDDKSRERLTLARQALEDNKTESILWTCADNTFATLTLEDFKAINTLSATRSTQLHEQYNKLKLLINSLETEEQIKAVTFDTDTSTITINTGN